MRKVTKTYEVYSFNELSEKAKQRAIENERRFREEDPIYSEFVDEFIKEQLADLKLPTDDVRWRISYSQGDGLAFYGKISEDNPIVKSLNIPDLEVTFSIEKVGPHLYDHYNTMAVVAKDYGVAPEDEAEHKRINNEIHRITKKLEEHIKEVSGDLFKKATMAYEYYFEDEAISDDLIDLEVEFLSDGTVFVE